MVSRTNSPRVLKVGGVTYSAPKPTLARAAASPPPPAQPAQPAEPTRTALEARGSTSSTLTLTRAHALTSISSLYPAYSALPHRRSEVVLAEASSDASCTRLRRRVKLYHPGTFVEVWSAIQQQWMFDGEVLRVAGETMVESGMQVPAGSMNVAYAGGAKQMWMPPYLSETQIRPSPRPKAPAPMAGTMLACNMLLYFELRKGMLMWWDSQELARIGNDVEGAIHLAALKQWREGDAIHVQTAVMQDEVVTFQAASGEEAEAWMGSLAAHAEYCQAVEEYSRANDPRLNKSGRLLGG